MTTKVHTGASEIWLNTHVEQGSIYFQFRNQVLPDFRVPFSAVFYDQNFPFPLKKWNI